MPCPRVRLALAVTLCATAAFAQPPAGAPGSVGPVDGDVAPRVVIRLVDGRLLDTSTLTGRAYVLDFWHPSCGPCRGYVPRLNAAHRRLARAGALDIGVLAGPADGVDHARLRRAWGIRYPTGTPQGPDDQSARSVFPRLPAMYAVGADGRIAADARDHHRLDALLLSDELLRVLAPRAVPSLAPPRPTTSSRPRRPG